MVQWSHAACYCFAQGYSFVWAPAQLWSVPVECQFYALFVVLWWLFSRLRVKMFTLLLVVLLLLAMSAPKRWAGPYFRIVECTCDRFCLPQFMTVFTLGMLLGAQWSTICSRLPRSSTALSILGPVAFAVIIAHHYTLERRWFSLMDSLGFISFPIFTANTLSIDPLVLACTTVLFLAAGSAVPSLAWLESKAFTFLGEISYGLYLTYLRWDSTRRFLHMPTD